MIDAEKTNPSDESDNASAAPLLSPHSVTTQLDVRRTDEDPKARQPLFFRDPFDDASLEYARSPLVDSSIRYVYIFLQTLY